MPEWKLLHSDYIALTKADAHRCVSSLFVTGLPSPSPSVTLPGLRLPASASLSLASCWPRPQQRLPVSAAGGGRRCCSQRERLWIFREASPLRQRLSLWESWREAPERARMPEWKLLHSDYIALTKADAHRCVSSLFVTGLPSPSPSVTLPGLRLPASASLSLASCWPRPQQRLPVSAAGGGRRCCSQRERLWIFREASPLRQRLSLWESWRGAPERARMPEWKLLHSDPIALTKADAYRCVRILFVTGLPSPSPPVTPLPKGEALDIP